MGRSPHKLSRWLALCCFYTHLSRKFLGFEVDHFNLESLRLLYDEIFVREEYFFNSDKVNPVIFDCGANIGMATLFFKWLYPESTVTAFEPDPDSFGLLQHNIKANHLQRVSAYNIALWDSEARIPFFVDDHEHGALTMSTKRDRGRGRQIEVEARRLSDFIAGPVDLLKVDVEGAETRVLCELIASGKMAYVRRMILEYHHHIGKEPAQLGSFFTMLEHSGWNYQLNTWSFPLSKVGSFQDILIYAYRDSN